MPCVAVRRSHDFAENWWPVDDLDLRALPLGGAGAYPAELCSLDELDEPVDLSHRRPIFVAEVMPCLHLGFGQRAVGEPSPNSRSARRPRREVPVSGRRFRSFRFTPVRARKRWHGSTLPEGVRDRSVLPCDRPEAGLVRRSTVHPSWTTSRTAALACPGDYFAGPVPLGRPAPTALPAACRLAASALPTWIMETQLSTFRRFAAKMPLLILLPDPPPFSANIPQSGLEGAMWNVATSAAAGSPWRSRRQRAVASEPLAHCAIGARTERRPVVSAPAGLSGPPERVRLPRLPSSTPPARQTAFLCRRARGSDSDRPDQSDRRRT